MDRTAMVEHVEGLLAQPRDVDDAASAALLAEVRARLFHTTTPPAAGPTRFGRHHVRGTLGVGGIGVVLRAHDPQLGRDVAIKIVRHGADAAAQRRLLREARAIARLSHPNVVAVYDVGRLDAVAAATHGGGVYVVMELVEGQDLARWLATPREVATILAAFVDAGRGLVAAHGHGLLHRDFKPHNVLMGDDGRARVADFGLTLGGMRPPAPDAAVDVSVTAPGMIVGTPLYMSPEQQAGADVDARTDQYAFCMALREALWGRPQVDSLAALHELKTTPPSLPLRPGVSRRIVRAIERGLAPDRERRWPTMQALLDVLSPPRKRSRVRWFAIAAGAVVVAAIATPMLPRGASAGICAPDDAGWANVWGDEVRREVQAAFERSSPAFAAAAGTAVDEELSARGTAWTSTRDRLCDTSPNPAAIECLAQRRASAQAIVEQWRAGTPEATMRAVDAAEALGDPHDCDPASGVAAGVVPNDADVIAIESLSAAGRIVEAADRARATAVPADPRGAARTGLAIGTALDAAGDFVAAEAALVHAHDAAQLVDDHVTAARIGARLVTVTGVHLGRPDDADLWARHAWTAVARADDPAALRGEVLLHLGHLAAARGQWQDALDHYTAHADVLAEERGADDLVYARALENVANTRIHLGDADGAITVLRRTLALERTRLGEQHPDVAVTRHNLSTALLLRGEHDEAEQQCRTALAVWRTAYGEEHPDVGLGRYTLGSILLDTGRAEAAVTELEAAVVLRRALLGEEHSDVLGTMNNLATALDIVGRPEQALVVLEDVVRIYDRPGTRRPDHGVMRLNYGNMLRRTGDPARARLEHERAIVLLDAEVGAGHIATGVAWFSLATDDRLLGDLDAAEADLAHAIAILGAALPTSHARWVGVRQEQGRIAAARGDLATARTAFAAALEQHAANPGVDESADELRAELAAVEQEARR